MMKYTFIWKAGARMTSLITFLISNGENAVQKEENSRRKIRKNETYFSFGIVIIDICKSIFRDY